MRSRARSWLVGPIAFAALGMITAPAAAQSGASIHLDVDGGAYAGAYDVESPTACLVDEAGGWSVSYADEAQAQAPSSIELSVGGGFDLLTITFGGADGYVSTDLQLTAERHDVTASLSVTAAAGDLAMGGAGPVIATIKLNVDCHQLEGSGVPEPTRAPLPTAQVQGPPAPGSTVFHVSLEFGPWAGTYDAWTLDDACFVSPEGAWSAWFEDPAALPSTVSLIATRAEGADAPVGIVSIAFGSPPDVTRYLSIGTADVHIDDSGKLQVSDASARAGLPDLSGAIGAIQLDIDCAAVVR